MIDRHVLESQWKRVARLIPRIVAISVSPTVISPSYKIETICDSVNLDFVMTSPLMLG